MLLNLNEIKAKYKSYPKSAKIDAFGQNKWVSQMSFPNEVQEKVLSVDISDLYNEQKLFHSSVRTTANTYSKR